MPNGNASKKLSLNFSLREMTKSRLAIRNKINNQPDSIQLQCLQDLVDNILQPIRTAYGRPVSVNSGFRCLELNRLLRSKDTSQHVLGQAADIEIPARDNMDTAMWIRDNLPFDKLILEYYHEASPRSGWIHVSYNEKNNRKEVITINDRGIFSDLRPY
jgi:zinc D-Ala-D-Ala carboxypeptidase